MRTEIAAGIGALILVFWYRQRHRIAGVSAEASSGESGSSDADAASGGEEGDDAASQGSSEAARSSEQERSDAEEMSGVLPARRSKRRKPAPASPAPQGAAERAAPHSEAASSGDEEVDAELQVRRGLLACATPQQSHNA